MNVSTPISAVRLLLTAFAVIAATACATAPLDISAALADPHRPAVEVSRDANREPAGLIDFAGIRPGMKVVDLLPGGPGAAYFTRIFSGVVGPQGKVYAYYGTRYDERLRAAGIDPDNQGVQLADFKNVVALHSLLDNFKTPEPVDLVWTSDNYHDLHNANFLTDVTKMNAAIFAALKPGGVYLVVDHRAVDGAGVAVTGTLHRMDEAVARREIEAAGFRFVAASAVLTRPADDRTKAIVETGLHDHTDQFVLKFRKPN